MPGRELQDRLTLERGLLGQQSAASSAVLERQATESSPLAVNIDRWVWEFPPARPTAPGRKRYRRSSALAAPGVILQKGWLQVCKCMSERREESAHSAGAPWSDALGVEMREGKERVLGSNGPPQKCGHEQAHVCVRFLPEARGSDLVTGKSTTQRPQLGPTKNVSCMHRAVDNSNSRIAHRQPCLPVATRWTRQPN